ncbi:unnamed protein product [Discosporangium mesarthrocarpum]
MGCTSSSPRGEDVLVSMDMDSLTEEELEEAPFATVVEDCSCDTPQVIVTRKLITDLQIDELENMEFLANGGFCVVYSCVFRGQGAVLKTPRNDCPDPIGAVEDLKREIATYERLATGGGNVRLCEAFGSGTYTTVTGVNKPFLVLERLEDDTLAHVLDATRGQKIKKTRARRRGGVCPPLAFLSERLQLGLELAQSLVYLHDEAIPGGVVIHRDLKPTNVGFTKEGHVKVIDLGLSAMRDNREDLDDKYEMTGETGSKRFMAPEVCKGIVYNEKADVYSFSIVLWEMCALTKPFAHMGADEHYREVIEKGKRPLLDKSWPEGLNRLLESCWHDDPNRRPDARAVAARLQELVWETRRKKARFSVRISI